MISGKNFLDEKRILLVIAHPDDEAMFFTPTLLAARRCSLLSILCFSTGILLNQYVYKILIDIHLGNADGLGAIRRAEMKRSGTYFGIDSSLISVIDHDNLQDGMDQIWPHGIISRLVSEKVSEFRPDMVCFMCKLNFIVII